MTELPSVHALLKDEIARGLETGVQLSVSLAGQVLDLAVGTNGAGHDLTSDTQVPWTCSSKPLGAAAFAVAWDEGLIDLTTPVHEVLPEFGGGLHDRVRVRDLLAHTSGISEPMMSVDVTAVDVSSWDDIDAFVWKSFCAEPCTTIPGTTMQYAPVSHWFALDRLLNTLSGGESGDTYRTMLARLGLDATLGPDWALPESGRVAVGSGEASGEGLEYMQLASALPLPGVGVWGPVRDLRIVGEFFLAGGRHQGEQVISARAVAALTATHWGVTPTHSMTDWAFPYGLGFMTLPALFGERCSPQTYGHAGGNTSTLLVDPLQDLVVAVYWNGRLETRHSSERRFALVRALHDDLGLTQMSAGATVAADS